MLFRSVLLFAAAANVFGQQALKDALGLTQMQVWQFQQQKAVAAPSRGAALAQRPGIPTTANPEMEYPASLQRALENPILDASQRAKLAGIVKVLDRRNAASEAIALGLIREEQWPGQTFCPVSIHEFPKEFGLSESQLSQVEELRRAAEAPLHAQLREMAMHRDELLKSGLSVDSPEVKATENSKLYQQMAAIRQRRDLAFSVLDDAQKSKLAAFENDLKLTAEAMQLKLIPYVPKGEILCQ